MEVKVVLYLPRDAASVPVSRQVLDGCLQTLGVTPDTRADIALALSEACANVIKHAGPCDEYEVQVNARNGQCEIEVVNTGSQEDRRAPDRSEGGEGWAGPVVLTEDAVPAVAEHGRGLKIIDAVVDNLQLTPKRTRRYDRPLREDTGMAARSGRAAPVPAPMAAARRSPARRPEGISKSCPAAGTRRQVVIGPARTS